MEQLMLMVPNFFVVDQWLFLNFYKKSLVAFWPIGYSRDDITKFDKSLQVWFSEADIGGVLWKKVLLEISENSEENTCARISFQYK